MKPLKSILVGLVLIFAILGLATFSLAQENYLIGPADDPTEINPMPAEGWLAMDNLPPRELELYKLTYLRGFMDALRFSEVIPEKSLDLLDEFKGTSLKQLAGQIDRFYVNNPQYRHISPATVMVIIMPRLKQGLPAMPDQENGTNGQTSNQAN